MHNYDSAGLLIWQKTNTEQSGIYPPDFHLREHQQSRTLDIIVRRLLGQGTKQCFSGAEPIFFFFFFVLYALGMCPRGVALVHPWRYDYYLAAFENGAK